MSIRLFIKSLARTGEVYARQGQLLAEVIKASGMADSEFGYCGFGLECATCAVKLGRSVGDMSIEEEVMLKAIGKGNEYRCSCQIKVTADMEDLTIELP
jgi:ferredoxin